MRRLLLIAVIALFASNSVAQPLPDSARSPKPLRIVAGLDGGVLLTQGDFRRNLGPRSAGVNAFISLRSASGWAIGARLTGSELYKRKETIGLSGLSVDLKTTTSLTRVGLFGQFGPRLMGVRPYGEALLGLHILSTDTKIAGESRKDPNSENQKTSVAPAVGLAVGVEVDLGTMIGSPAALRVEGRRTYGGSADYLVYSDTQEEFTERSSGTSTTSVSLGLTFNF